MAFIQKQISGFVFFVFLNYINIYINKYISTLPHCSFILFKLLKLQQRSNIFSCFGPPLHTSSSSHTLHRFKSIKPRIKGMCSISWISLERVGSGNGAGCCYSMESHNRGLWGALLAFCSILSVRANTQSLFHYQ